MMPRNLGSTAALAIGMVVFAPSMAQTAASYPEKPVRLVVPFSPGGALDVVAWMLGQATSDARGWLVLIDDRVGAGV